MQAIQTKRLAATNTRGQRIKATAQAGTITIAWDHSVNYEANHRAAAMAFANKLQWEGRWVGGFTDDSNGVFVCDDAKFSMAFTVTAEA